MSESSHAKSAKPLLSDSVYNTLKNTAVVILPAMGALYFALAQIWHLPNAEEVVGSISALNVFIGALVSASMRSYNKTYNKDGIKYVGDLVAEPHPEDHTRKIFVAHLNDDPAAIARLSEATFKVK